MSESTANSDVLLFGQLETPLPPADLAAALCGAGIEAEARESSLYWGGIYVRLYVDDEVDFTLERIEAARYMARADAIPTTDGPRRPGKYPPRWHGSPFATVSRSTTAATGCCFISTTSGRRAIGPRRRARSGEQPRRPLRRARPERTPARVLPAAGLRAARRAHTPALHFACYDKLLGPGEIDPSK